MPQREVIIKGGPNKTAAFVTGKEELLVRLGSEAVGLATESTLQSVLTTLQAFTEYEAKFVVDANNETFLEVRVWNEDTGTWSGTPTYYRPGETTVASPAPVAPIVYADNAPILANILTEIQSITYAEDTPHVSGGNGVFVLGVRNDLDAVLTSNDGDYSPIAVTDKGAVKVDAAISFPSNLDVNVFDGAGTNPITSTTVGPDTGLDVYIVPANAALSLDSLEETGTTGDLSALSVNITSISFLSTGTANALISVNGGATFINVAPGTNISFDAGSPSNVFVGSSFYWDTLTNAGSALTIVYSYL